MRSNYLKATLKTAVFTLSILLLGASASFAQTVNLTAGPANATLPDGSVVPMWGYTCTVTASATPSTDPKCAALNPNAGTGWSPVVITVPTGQALQISLTNSLTFGANSVPTSLVIVGQLGGGLGDVTQRTTKPSPDHTNAQSVTWPIAGTGPGQPPVGAGTPPNQGDRVQSFSTEVAAGTTATLTWGGTGAPALRPGTYLIESGTHPSIQGPMGLYGILVVTDAAAGCAYPGATTGTCAVSYNAEVPLLLSEIDPVQNRAVSAAVGTVGFTETAVWSGQPGFCGNPKNVDGTANPNYQTCYPPAVNYDPRYYLIDGVSLDRANLANSMFATTPATATGTVLVRFVNAGLHMHIPSIVGAQTGAGGPSAPSGFSLIAEDGNVLPGVPRVQSEVFMAPGKTYDVMINAPATGAPSLPVFDRQLSLSTNNQRDGGMQGYIGANGAVAPAAGVTAMAVNDQYSLVAGSTLTVSDPGKGVIANDVGVYGVRVLAAPGGGTLTVFNADGTFTYVPNSGTTSDTFTYCGNTASGVACPGILTGTVNLQACSAGGTAATSCLGGAPTAVSDTYTSRIASQLQVAPPGVLENDTDPQGHALTAVIVGSASGGAVTLNADGSFTAVPACAATTTGCVGVATTMTFQYNAVNSQNTSSAATGASGPATVTVNFLAGSGLSVSVKDTPSGGAITDYRWIIEEDRTFYIDPNCQVNQASTTTRPVGCPPLPAPSLGTNFHTSYMPVVASGCVGSAACESGQTIVDPTNGTHPYAVCDIGNGVCRSSTSLIQQRPVDPSQVNLDPTKRYYISIFPGDAGNSFTSGSGGPQPDPTKPNGQRQFSIALDCGPYDPTGAGWAPGTGTCGHTMGGAPISPVVAPATTFAPVTVLLQETPLPTAKIAVYVFEDDSPLNGEVDVHGGTDAQGTSKEPGLGGFEITLFDDAGGTGDATGQMTYDMFNMNLSNSLAGTIDQLTGKDACPISPSTSTTDHLVGMIVTCPHFESDGVTVSPLEGQAVIANMMPGRYGVVATPGADRIAKGEEWVQTNTLDGQKAHDSFIKVGGPAYFQEFGPAGYHVSIGFANPKVINNRRTNTAHTGMCDPAPNGGGLSCHSTLTGIVTTARISRPPDERLYSSGTHDSFGFTQCYVSVGDPDDDDFAFAKCDTDGHFSFSNLPPGNWRVTAFDQWNDQIVDGLSTPVALSNTTPANMEIATQQWHTNIYTQTYFDQDGNGIRNGNEPGLTLLPTNIRFRDGSYSNFNNTDLGGNAGFNEIFPLFNWYVVEADTTRYKQTGVHVVYDAGGVADTAGNEANLARTTETVHLPTNLRVPGAVYCANADCPGGIAGGSSSTPSTGRIDPPWVTTEGWQGFSGQNAFIEFGKAPYAPGETGGIRGEVIYASTRPFDDPTLLIHTSWTPDVPGVTINLYQELTAPDGTQTLKLVDHTKTTSWDDWAQGFHTDPSNPNGLVPNMNCPGQGDGSADLFFFTLMDSPLYLNPGATLPNHSQFKCYDGMHNFNQIQPAPYDGMYLFPSIIGRDPVSGLPTGTGSTNGVNGSRPGTNCTICVASPDGLPMLPAGKYVVEMITPPGYELVKEEDKNILIGDNYIAPVTQQFGGLANIFIMPDQAEVAGQYNPYNVQQPTNNLGSQPRHEGDTGSVETFWPCVGALRIVPDYISLFPYSAEVSPFAGASRHLCDRKEVTLEDQSQALAKFWIFSSTHVAAHYTGFVLDDFSSEFDPFSPQFGEKFAVPNLPVSIKDFAGNEISRVYTDQWGQYNGLNYSTWEVNPPNPTGYAPTMMVACMNDPGNGPTPDPLYNPSYSQFCYEIPYMPGQTQYMDTPVVPTAAFAEGYNPPDCAYPDATPSISTVTGDAIPGAPGGGRGPWVSASGTGHTLTITALAPTTLSVAVNGSTVGAGIQVPNNAYSGPSATAVPYNQKFVTRHYGFGTQCTSPSATSTTCNTLSSVTIGGVNAPIVSWVDDTITVTVPTIPPGLNGQGVGSTCGSSANQTPPQRGGPNGSSYRCGQLVITAGNGKKSIDTVTVTVSGKTPTYVNGENASNTAIQNAIDTATPGDLIIVGPGNYSEMLLMWKPVRLQGVGAASVKVNANTHPSGKIDAWRRRVDCLFGLSLSGGYISNTNPFDPNHNFTCPASQQRKVDAIPLEPIVGWDPTLNGNIAELLQEPTLMGAYEGAGITVLAKGVRDVNGQADPNCVANGICTPLNSGNADCTNYPSNFRCNPSRVDGMSFVNSSGGGGAIFLHGWNHFTEVSNNRVYANAGTLTGGIVVGQMETTDGTILGTQEQAFGYNVNVHVHHNSVTNNASYGDELNSTTPAAAGGVTICTGADNYKFDFNWVCGNLSSGDGGGFDHYGFSYNGTISNNWFLFNQSTNPTIPTHGGGVGIIGAAPDGTICENLVNDTDCAPQLSDGVGPGLLIDSNLILGNTAESGSGGGIRFQAVNGTEVTRNPLNPGNWYGVRVTNNIIANNVAGWDGGGVSLQDSLNVDFINNTVVTNDTTASSGVLFNTLGSAHTSMPPPGCSPNPDPNQPQDPSCFYAIAPTSPQPAGLSVQQNSSNLTVAMASVPGGVVTCPGDHFQAGTGTGTGGANNANCRLVSYPLIRNDMFWQNRAFNIVVGGPGPGNQNQQNLVTLTPTLNQNRTGSCPGGTGSSAGGTGTPSYWDIGVRGDSGPGSHNSGNGLGGGSGPTLNPMRSILTSLTGGYNNNNNLAPTTIPIITEYCNGARVPPENGGLGYNGPAGISDATLPNPIFSLTAGATVDEGNNWVNMTYGPLTLNAPVTNSTATGPTLGNFSITSSSAAFNTGSATNAPNHDFFGTSRPQGGLFDIGAVEALAPIVPPNATLTGNGAFGTVRVGLVTHDFTLSNAAGAGTLSNIAVSVTGTGFSRVTLLVPNNCGTTLAGGASCTIRVAFTTTTRGVYTGSLSVTGTNSAGTAVTVTNSPITLTGTAFQIVLSYPGAPGTLTFNTTTNTTRTVTVQNWGSGSITLNSVTFSGTNFGSFARPAGSAGGTCGASVGGAIIPDLVPTTCTIVISFTAPAANGTYTATFNLNDNDQVTPRTINLSGTRP
jgi:Bacterial cadherin-like domain